MIKNKSISLLNFNKRSIFVRGMAAAVLVALVLCVFNFNSVVSAAATDITGKAFRDYNANGLQDNGAAGLPDETQGIGGLTVTAYDSSGTATATAMTAADGSYTLSNVTGLQRVEFTGLPSWLQQGVVSANGGGAVQFVSAGATNVNFAAADPQDYSPDRNPQLALTSFVAGNWQDGNQTTYNTINRFPYSSSGASVKPAIIGNKSDTGSVWGAAYQRSSNRLFTAAFVRRHSSLYENPVGVPHPGQIFLTANATTVSPASASTVPFFDVATVAGVNPGTVLSNTARGIAGANADLTADPSTYGQVGKTALGDLEMSPDDRSLWTISLNDKMLVKIALPASGPPSASDAFAYQIPEPVANPCAAGSYRPFALSFHQGKLYVGGVCDEAGAGGQAANLKAVVMSVDPANVFAGFTEEYVLPLNYTKGLASEDFDNTAAFTPNCGQARYNWHPWTDDYAVTTAEQKNVGNCLGNYPEPMLTDLQFDDDGSMVLAFADRFSYQITSFANAPNYPANSQFEFDFLSGDLIRACSTGNAFVTEGANGCTRRHVKLNAELNLMDDATHCPYFSDTDNQGANGGEWYWGDVTRGSGNSVPAHMETASGGTELLAGSNQVVSTSMSPVRLNSAGVKFFNNQTGKDDVNYEIFTPNQTLAQAKSGALGDLELLTAAAPVEIGNRIWNDSNHNGVQDPNERALPGVTVQMVINGIVVASAVTDALGNYYFTNNPNQTSTGSAVSNISQLQPGVLFTIQVPLNQPALNSLTVTQPNVGGGAVAGSPADGRDSDGNNAGSVGSPVNTGFTAVSAVAGAVYNTFGAQTTISPGANNQSYDFGFFTSVTTAAQVSLSGKTVNESGRALSGVVITVQSSDGTRVAARSNSFGYFQITGLNAGTVAVLTPVFKGYRFVGNNYVYSLTDSLSGIQLVGQTPGLKKDSTLLRSNESSR